MVPFHRPAPPKTVQHHRVGVILLLDTLLQEKSLVAVNKVIFLGFF
jgi:hypothetical protein